MLIRIIHKVLPKLFQTVVEYFVFCILKLPAMYQKCIIKKSGCSEAPMNSMSLDQESMHNKYNHP